MKNIQYTISIFMVVMASACTATVESVRGEVNSFIVNSSIDKKINFDGVKNIKIKNIEIELTVSAGYLSEQVDFLYIPIGKKQDYKDTPEWGQKNPTHILQFTVHNPNENLVKFIGVNVKNKNGKEFLLRNLGWSSYDDKPIKRKEDKFFHAKNKKLVGSYVFESDLSDRMKPVVLVIDSIEVDGVNYGGITIVFDKVIKEFYHH